MATPVLMGAIEGGGTKFNCAVFDTDRTLLAQTRIPTTTHQEVLARVIAFFREQNAQGLAIQRLGLATFGPLDLDPTSHGYGALTRTPKPGWSGAPLAATLREALGCPVIADTDVNGAALAEVQWGAARGASVAVYVTIGTGVGGGVVVNGAPLRGLIHPEIGHMRLAGFDHVQGVCPFHGNCVEGLASGAAMAQIWGSPAPELPADHEAWRFEAEVLGALCATVMAVYSPQRLVLGGGVLEHPGLFEAVIAQTRERMAGYWTLPNGVTLESVIARPALAPISGLYGAYALAADA